MRHDHHEHCKHTLAFCEKCDVPYCSKCNFEWAKPCRQNHYNWWVNTSPSILWGTSRSTLGGAVGQLMATAHSEHVNG